MIPGGAAAEVSTMTRLPRALRLAVLAAALAAALAAGEGGAQTTVCQPKGEVHACVAEGFAPILQNDITQAREEAVLDAQRRSIEQVSGVFVDSETITRNQMLFDEMVRTRARGLVQNTAVLESGKVGDGEFRVKIEAWVKAGDVKGAIPDLIPELSVVVLLPEQNMGQPRSQPVVENEVVTRLADAGYRVLDPGQLGRIAERDQLAARLRGDDRLARELGLRFLANLLIIGEATTDPSQSTQGITSAYARVTARIMEAETGRVIPGGNVSLAQVRGFHTNMPAAGERALLAAAPQAADRLRQALDGYFKRKERRLEVRIKGLPSLDDYRGAKAFLEKLRWVNGSSEGGWSRDESLIVLNYPEKTLYLAARIKEEKRYRLIEFDRNRILLEYRP